MPPRYPLILVRHGQAEHHTKAITGGWTDSELTETGVQQANRLGERLRQELGGPPTYLGCSHLRRAVHTAEIIGIWLETPPNVHHSLSDLNNGVAAGKTHAEARSYAIPPSQPIVDWQPYPQAESWRQFYLRVSKFMDKFSERQEQPAVLVTHSATVHAIVAWWLKLPVDSRTHFEVAPGSVSVLRFNRWREHSIERLNDTAHLYALGLTNPIKL